jgi:hypothetical protein
MSSPRSLPVQLHHHALESIFGFLSFDGLYSAMLVDRDWLAAVSSMRGLAEGGKELRSMDHLAAALTSRLARHVSALDVSTSFQTFTRAVAADVRSHADAAVADLRTGGCR